MAKKFLTPIDLSNLELQYFRVQNVAGILAMTSFTAGTTSPTGMGGKMFFDSASNVNKLVFSDGTKWVALRDTGTKVPWTDLSGIPRFYIGTTEIQSITSGNPVAQDLAGIKTITMSGTAPVITFADGAYIEYKNGKFHFSKGLYSDEEVSALGAGNSGTGGSGSTGGDGIITGLLTSWTEGYVDTDALSATLGVNLNSRVAALEANGALSFVGSGSGNVVTAISKTGTSVTVTKGLSVYSKTEVDQKIADSFAVQDAMIYKGVLNATTSGIYTPAASKGDTYKVATAGKINGIAVEVGDMLICNNDNTLAGNSSNVNTVKTYWDIIQTNLTSYVTTFGEKSGAITLLNGSSTNGAINLTMNNNQLQASIVGLAAAAYKGVDTAVTNSSSNLITSGGVYTYVTNQLSHTIYACDIESGKTGMSNSNKTFTTTQAFDSKDVIPVLYDNTNALVETDITVNADNKIVVNFASAITVKYRLVVFGKYSS